MRRSPYEAAGRPVVGGRAQRRAGHHGDAAAAGRVPAPAGAGPGRRPRRRRTTRRSHAPSAELVKARREIHRLQQELERRGTPRSPSCPTSSSGAAAKLERGIGGARGGARCAGAAPPRNGERLMRARGEALAARDEAAAARDGAAALARARRCGATRRRARGTRRGAGRATCRDRGARPHSRRSWPLPSPRRRARWPSATGSPPSAIKSPRERDALLDERDEAYA